MKTALALLAAFVFGSLVGAAVEGEPPPEIIRVPDTKVIHDPAPPPVEVTVFPESCKLAVSYADVIDNQAGALYAKGDRQLDLISQVRVALASQGDLTEIEERQRDLQGTTVDNLFNLSQAMTRFEAAYDDCTRELND